MLLSKRDGLTWSTQKNFEMTLEFKICFRRLVWVRGYPQKQTGWSYDAWNDFYRTRRAEMAIFWFSTPQKAIFKDFKEKNEDLRNFWKSHFSKIGKNITFYASEYHQISCCGVVWVQSFPTKCVTTSETTPIHFHSLKRAEIAIFVWFSTFLMEMASKAPKIAVFKTWRLDLRRAKKFFKWL